MSIHLGDADQVKVYVCAEGDLVVEAVVPTAHGLIISQYFTVPRDMVWKFISAIGQALDYAERTEPE